MKITTKLLCLTIVVTSFLACNRRDELPFIGPENKAGMNVQLIDPLKTKDDIQSVDFRATPIVPFFFTAKFDNSIKWKLTITGDISGATKTFIGTSSQIDSLTSLWRGEQDSLYYFTSETCKATLSDYYPTASNEVYNSLSANAAIIPTAIKITSSISITIARPKSLPSNAAAIFDFKNANGGRGVYTVQYEGESCNQSEVSPEVQLPNNTKTTCLSKAFLPFSTNGGPIYRYRGNVSGQPTNSPYYFLMKGTDYNSNYYVGRIQRDRGDDTPDRGSEFGIFLKNHPNIKAEDLWFNVFVYGTGDGSKLNYTIKEDDDNSGLFQTTGSTNCTNTKEELAILNTYTGTNDDAFEKSILLNFTGWKLFSFKYSDFSVIKDGLNGDGKGEYNPNKITAIQFSLVAPDKGQAGQVIFDYPVMTLGSPLKY